MSKHPPFRTLLRYSWKNNRGLVVVTVLENIFSAFLPLIDVMGIGAVFQDYTAFAFTIAENITMREEKADLSQVLSEVDLDEFVNGLPNGADTYLSKKLSPDGMEFSGGQGQKTALARALYKNAPHAGMFQKQSEALHLTNEFKAHLDKKKASRLGLLFCVSGSCLADIRTTWRCWWTGENPTGVHLIHRPQNRRFPISAVIGSQLSTSSPSTGDGSFPLQGKASEGALPL